jgi:hypothetical protein
MTGQITSELITTSKLSPYLKFKMALKSKEVQRQYLNLLGRFLDYYNFEGFDPKQKATKFFSFVKSKSSEEIRHGYQIRYCPKRKDRQ